MRFSRTAEIDWTKQPPEMSPSPWLRLLSNDFASFFVVPQGNEFDVTYVACVRPIEKFKGCHQLRSDPDSFGHLGCGQSLSPSPGARLRKVHKRRSIDAAALQLRKERATARRDKASTNSGNIDELRRLSNVLATAPANDFALRS